MFLCLYQRAHGLSDTLPLPAGHVLPSCNFRFLLLDPLLYECHKEQNDTNLKDVRDMKVTVQIMSQPIKKFMGWDNRKTEETYLFEGNTIADLFRVVRDQEGKSFYDRFVDDDGYISRSYIYLDGISYLRKEDLRRSLQDGGKIAILGQLACCGGG